MSLLCIPPALANKIKDAVRSGDINPAKLMEMDSVKRRKFFEGLVGDEAKGVNLLFEKKMLLKDQQRGMYDWIREVTGLSKEAKEAASRKIKEAYAEKKRRLYEPKAEEKFLDELVSDIYTKKFKTDVDLKEAHKITELTSKMAESKKLMNEDHTWGNGSEADRIKYGAEKWGSEKVALENYIGELKIEANKQSLINPLKGDRVEKASAMANNARVAWNFVADNARAIKASLDNSLWFRQGLKALMDPQFTGDWVRNFAKSWKDIGKTIWAGGIKWDKSKGVWDNVKDLAFRNSVETGNSIMDAVKADIYSRKNFLNGNYERGIKLDIGKGEEEIPTSAPEQIPILGRAFKASEVAYSAGAMRLRVDMVDKFYKMAEKNGLDLSNPKEVGSINYLVNSLTGRGNFRQLGESGQAFTNQAFFSIKFFKSNVDFLLKPLGVFTSRKGDPGHFAKRKAMRSLISTAVNTTALLMTADALWPGAVEWDPRSSNFGKIQINDTRFDVTGGYGGLIILASRLFTGKSKSGTTGAIHELGTDYGETSGWETFTRFAKNKLSPIAGTAWNMIDRSDFEGNEMTFSNITRSLFTPIPYENYKELKTARNAANLVATMLADSMGVSSNTYGLNFSEAEDIYYEVKDLPPEEITERMRDIKADSPKLYQKILDVKESEENGFTATDRYIDQAGIKDGEKARLVYSESMKIKDLKERNDYIKVLRANDLLDDKSYGYVKELISDGEITSLKPENLSPDEYINQRGTLGLVSDYAEAFFIDRENAQKALFTEEELGIVEGNLVQLQRMYGEGLEDEPYSFDPDVGITQGTKKRLMEAKGLSWGQQGDYKLEHILQVSAGGDSSDENLMIVKNEEHDMYTPIDRRVGYAVKNGDITRQEAEDLMIKFKVNKTITAEAVIANL